MILGNLHVLSQAGLPTVLRDILAFPQCSFEALQAGDDGRFQLPGAEWFCTVGSANTQMREVRHTEYHHHRRAVGKYAAAGGGFCCVFTGRAALGTVRGGRTDDDP